MNLQSLHIPPICDVNRSIARMSHLEFVKYNWQLQSEFLTGFHTQVVSDRLDRAFADFKKGKSSFFMVRIPFRHGKSELISRALVPHFLGEFPECETIVTSYNTQIAESFSRDARNMIDSETYRELYPNVVLDPDNKSIKKWGLTNKMGKTLWSGIGGALTGAGYHLGIVDDPLKNREEANSEIIREKRWEAFTEAFLTRRAPVSITLLVGTPWHDDDFFGRIEKEMEENERFPHFESLTFPAKAEDYTGDGDYRSEYLFPERFSKEWYEGQYASLGKYASSGLLDCSPKIKGGNILACQEGENWNYVDEKPEGFGRLYRSWDLASTKALAGNDPDWTVGIKGAIKVEVTKIVNPNTRKVDKLKMVSIYIEDIVRIREEAVKRNEKMIWTAHNDGQSCVHFIESFGAQKDTVTTLKSILGGSRIVKGVRHNGDKDFKITEALEVPLASGNVYVNRRVSKAMMDDVQEEFESFPFGTHDDICDSLAIMVNELTSKAYNAWWVKK